MAIALLNDIACIRADTYMPRQGVFYADIALDASKQVDGDAVLKLADGKLELHGTALRTGVFGEVAYLRLIGGAGGMSTPVKKKFYRQTTGKIVAQDILADAGEKLSKTADASILGRQLANYVQRVQPAGAALGLLCDFLDAIWRVLPDGTVWIGTESWPKADDPGDLLSESPADQRAVYGTEAPSLLPGTALGERYISIVQHKVSADQVTTHVHWETEPDDVDRQTRAERAVFDHFAARFRYLGRFAAKVVKQNADGPAGDEVGGTLELTLDDVELPGLTKVPIRYGIAGSLTKLKTPISARALVEFVGGSPTGAPVVTGWEASDIDTSVVAGTLVALGTADASKWVALAEEVNDRLGKLQAAFDAHVHSPGELEVAGPYPVSGLTGAATLPLVPPVPPPTIPVGSLADVGSTVVKVNA
jgi:hypothetical protein